MSGTACFLTYASQIIIFLDSIGFVVRSTLSYCESFREIWVPTEKWRVETEYTIEAIWFVEAAFLLDV